MKEENAKISETMLGFEGHGLLTCFFYFSYGGHTAQGFGGYHLMEEHTDAWIRGILKTVGVEKWENLEGTPIRVRLVDGRVKAIGNFLEDKWFDPSTL